MNLETVSTRPLEIRWVFSHTKLNFTVFLIDPKSPLQAIQEWEGVDRFQCEAIIKELELYGHSLPAWVWESLKSS